MQKLSLGGVFMNKNTAWKDFEKTGKIEAYIRYVQLKNGIVPEEEDAISDAGLDYKGEYRR